jgi:hypothetical protein
MISKHVPLFEKRTSKKTGRTRVYYVKRETDDHFFHRKSFAVSVRADCVDKADRVEIYIKHRNVVITAKTKDIKKSQRLVYYGETKYYHNINKWRVVGGDVDWTKRLASDLKNGRLVTPPCQ